MNIRAVKCVGKGVVHMMTVVMKRLRTTGLNNY